MNGFRIQHISVNVNCCWASVTKRFWESVTKKKTKRDERQKMNCFHGQCSISSQKMLKTTVNTFVDLFIFKVKKEKKFFFFFKSNCHNFKISNSILIAISCHWNIRSIKLLIHVCFSLFPERNSPSTNCSFWIPILVFFCLLFFSFFSFCCISLFHSFTSTVMTTNVTAKNFPLLFTIFISTASLGVYHSNNEKKLHTNADNWQSHWELLCFYFIPQI